MTRRTRATVARHGRLRSPRPLRQLLALVAVAVAVVLTAGVGVASYAAIDLASTFQAGAEEFEGAGDTPPDIGEIEGGVNMLLVGTDTCEEEWLETFPGRCSAANLDDPELNDVTMLVHISDEPRRVTVISFPRDMMVPIPECANSETGEAWGATDRAMFNETYARGGLNCVASTIEQLADDAIEIQFAAKVTWGGVIDITDAIGGVEVCLAEPIYDPKNTGIDWPAGNRTIQGIEALEFLRTREGVGGSDLNRIANQQQYMSRLANKLISEEVLTDPATLYRLATTTVANVTPSANLTNPITLVQIALAVRDVPFDQIVFVRYPVFDDTIDPNRVAPDRTSATVMWDALAANQPLTLSGTVGTGVVEVTDPAATPAPTPTDGAVLSENVQGQNAAQQTCSAGNG